MIAQNQDRKTVKFGKDDNKKLPLHWKSQNRNIRKTERLYDASSNKDVVYIGALVKAWERLIWPITRQAKIQIPSWAKIQIQIPNPNPTVGKNPNTKSESKYQIQIPRWTKIQIPSWAKSKSKYQGGQKSKSDHKQSKIQSVPVI